MSEIVVFTVTDSLSGISCLFQAYKVAVLTPVSLETTFAEVSRYESSTAAVILSLYEQKASRIMMLILKFNMSYDLDIIDRIEIYLKELMDEEREYWLDFAGILSEGKKL